MAVLGFGASMPRIEGSWKENDLDKKSWETSASPLHYLPMQVEENWEDEITACGPSVPYSEYRISFCITGVSEGNAGRCKYILQTG